MKTLAVNRPFRNFLTNSFANPSAFENLFEGFDKEFASYVPAVNISNKGETYVLDFSVAGFNKEDFKIAIENEVLTVSAEHKVENNVEEKNYTRKEFNYGSFKRSFTLPENADLEKIEAKYENGILNITIPKKELVTINNTKEIKIS